MILEPEHWKFTTINTHQGLYQYTRLPFGIASAPNIFQQAMEKILQGLPKVVCYLDDVLVTGSSDREHITNLEEVFRRLKERGLRLKKSKCSFMKPSVQYLGYLVDAEGIHTSPEKVSAIVEAPRPANQQQLRAFLGLVNYYGKSLPSLSTTTYPLNSLLHKNIKWEWTEKCAESFKKLKEQLSSKLVLVHYDSKLPLRMACDASSYGVGAVIAHVMPDGSEKPVAYASRTLSKSEKNYAHTEKEALAIIFGIKKFHRYIYGRKFTLITDHKPLTTILSPKASLPALAAARIQRWAIILSAYCYEIEFCSTQEHSNADGLSRLPLETTSAFEESSTASLFNIHQIGTLPVHPEQLRLETARDHILSKVLRYTLNRWPTSVEASIQLYFIRRNEITVEAGYLMWGMKVIVPVKLQRWVIKELHTGHPGKVKVKSLTRIHVWWPGINQNIEELAKNCPSCQQFRNRPPPTTLHPWTWPVRPWHRVHIDYAGPFLGRYFLILVDAHSKWPEVVPMNSTTTDKTITELWNIFPHMDCLSN